MSFIYGEPEAPKVTSSNSYANGDNQNCGNVITNRPSIKLHHAPGGNSSVSFGGYDSEPTHIAPQAPAQVSPQAPPQAPPSSTGGTPADAAYYKKLTVQELRVLCRDRGLNPGGGKEQLHERLTEAINSGAALPVMVGGGAQQEHVLSSNNFARPDGQNTGNFLTDRNSSRVLAAPGGASSICLGDSEPSRPHSKAHSRQKEDEIQQPIPQGHNIFGEENQVPKIGAVGGVRKDPGGGSSLVLG
mmetsp:Transcript_32118/g.38891  ORF Transcript_32118/g.38891 Transcript_32118/m.38891 type:complete len:244 (-) Transcript_32118:322-1053(-)|eukprot:CAMPEP_0197864948 /NCGR_PEP_ID=MMETSP1438-20131217/43376_1 /TAXON_ID=1461541 /ORGANISM="Pterosperma sp., Strain CCMP1384" /LENGTH=243 /DNA_ID=CAMNT_0043483331 /DNA_START=103 /DNA_END=834 /DNA_ORIENTATION=+